MRVAAGSMVQEPDIVAVTLQRVMQAAPGISAEAIAQVEREIRAEFGGQRLFVPKGQTRLTPERRQAIYQDGLSAMENHEITQKHRIGRATLYRIMKEGGGRFS